MYNTWIMDYVERTAPDTALKNNTPRGAQLIRVEIKETLSLLVSAKNSFEQIGMNDDAKLCYDKALSMAAWLAKFGAF